MNVWMSINKGLATYINKRKALNYLHHSDRSISEALSNPRLDSATKVIENFENPSIEEEKSSGNDIFSRASNFPLKRLQERLQTFATGVSNVCDRGCKRYTEKRLFSTLKKTFNGERGNVVYEQAPIEDTLADLFDGALEQDEIDAFVDANISSAEKDVEKKRKQKPAMLTDKEKYLAEKTKWQNELAEAERKLEYWNNVK
ncbi:MAG: hypothetical protein ACI4UA_04295, partial [Bacteroidaceae bacterium]